MRKIFLVMLLLPVSVFGQQVNPIKLNTISLEKAKLASAGEDLQYLEFNNEAFESNELKKNSFFIFESEPGVIDELEITRVEHYLEGAVSILARKKGEQRNSFILSYQNGEVKGIYHRSEKEVLNVGYEKEVKLNYLSRKNIDNPIYSDKNDALIAKDYSKTPTGKSKIAFKSKSSVPTVNAMVGAIEDSITIDVMLVYTVAAEDWAKSNVGSIQLLIAQTMALSQAALDNSEIAIDLRLVHQVKTLYDETTDGVDSDKRLRRLTSSPSNRPVGDDWSGTIGYMDDIHTLRDQYGADIVALIARINDTGGLGWRLGDTSGNPEYGFSLNRVQQVSSGYTLIHEIGHNMGNSHSRTQLSSPAEGSGGLFHYSAGYQDKVNGFHTVMAYPDGLTQAPIFSSPNLTYQDKPTGTNSSVTPENNASSMSEIKKVIASYRTTKVTPPVLDPFVDVVTIEMNREDQLTIPISLSNSGTSRLMWDADFEFASNGVTKQKRTKVASEFKVELPTEALEYPANASFTQIGKEKSAVGETVVYSTSFETSEGFTQGNYSAINQWRALSSGNLVKISNANAMSGSNNLRLSFESGANTQFVSTPFFGAQAFGTYEVSMDLAVNGPGGLAERFDVYIYDGKNGGITGGIVITGGTIYAWDKDENGDGTFFSTSATVLLGQYRKLAIRFDNNTGVVSYYYGGLQIAESDYVEGRTPDEINFLHFNEESGAFIDIDNVSVKQLDESYAWLKVNSYGGVISPGASQNINLKFSTVGIAAGDYETMLKVQTNDPNNSVKEIPISLKVSTVVSNEELSESPKQITLNQNYPNPFNPETVISYSIKEATNVRLEVFNIQGQNVATLVNSKMSAGNYKARFNAEGLASGIYLYRLSTPVQTLTRQMVLIK